MDHPTRYYSDIQEKKIASFLGWKQVVGSGSTNFHKGDVESDNWLGECKTHIEPNHKLKFDFEVWKKISNEAHGCFKKPVLFSDDGSQDLDNTWCMCELENPSVFNKVQITWDRRISLYRTKEQLNALYEDSPYIFLVVERFKEKFALMPISSFKEYIERI